MLCTVKLNLTLGHMAMESVSSLVTSRDCKGHSPNCAVTEQTDPWGHFFPIMMTIQVTQFAGPVSWSC